jgi:hypothetical protein
MWKKVSPLAAEVEVGIRRSAMRQRERDLARASGRMARQGFSMAWVTCICEVKLFPESRVLTPAPYDPGSVPAPFMTPAPFRLRSDPGSVNNKA